MIPAHLRARDAIRSAPGDYPVGVSLAMQDEQAVGERSKRDRKCAVGLPVDGDQAETRPVTETVVIGGRDAVLGDVRNGS